MSVNKEKYLQYDELKKIVNSIGIKTKNEYCENYKSISFGGKKAPINPQSFYGRESWISWSDFLNKPIYKKKHFNVYHDFTECKEIIKSKNIKSKSDFYKKITNLIKEDNGIPYNPRSIYNDLWEGWGDFLGTGRIQDNKKIYLPYEDARNWSRSLNLKMYKEWGCLDMDKLPIGIPKKPEKTYKNKGWINYNDWLGIDEKTKISFGEKIIYDYLIDKKIKFSYNKSLLDCKNESKLRFDFYLPEKNICIEFDGIQHFKSVEFFGGDVEFQKVRLRDEIKNIFCNQKNIKLIRLPYFLKKIEIIEILEKGLN